MDEEMSSLHGRELGSTSENITAASPHPLIAVKSLVNAGNGTLVAPHVSDWSGYIIREKISTWCIERYFADDATPKPSRP